MKFINRLLWLAVAAMPAAAVADTTVSSPDGQTVVTIAALGGQPTYHVAHGGVQFLEASPLGLRTDLGDFTRGMTLNAEAVTTREVREEYHMTSIKQSAIAVCATEAVCPFLKDGKPAFDLIIRVATHDVAFRYRLHPQGKHLCAVVESEATGFRLPIDATTFLSPQVQPGGGFARTYPSYEMPYTTDDTLGLNGRGVGYTFPCLFRTAQRGWVLISETGTDGGYCGCRLMGGQGSLYTIGFPQEGENNGYGSVTPAVTLPAVTPWRTVTIGRDLAPIVETTVAWDVVEPKYAPSRPYKGGKGTWSWIMGQDPSCNYATQKEYIAFAAALGYQSVLVDALWDKRIGRDSIAALARYGKTLGVELFLWYNSNGHWNDAPQTPRNMMDQPVPRRREMAWMRSIGIRGIKVDFFGGDKQATMQLYEDILTDANDFGLQVIYHGCTLPRGWERMYPNYVASEAVLASENLHFTQAACDAEAFNAALHPFIRNTVGSMDFGGSALNRRYNATNADRGTRRRTSEVFALATAVLFQSSVQHFALAPCNLIDAPVWAIDFMKAVPTQWDETRYLDGYPGRYVILARRHGDKWFVAGINAQDEPVRQKLRLPMFEAGETVSVYADAPARSRPTASPDDTPTPQGNLRTVTLPRSRELTISIPRGGGIVIAQ